MKYEITHWDPKAFEIKGFIDINKQTLVEKVMMVLEDDIEDETNPEQLAKLETQFFALGMEQILSRTRNGGEYDYIDWILSEYYDDAKDMPVYDSDFTWDVDIFGF